MPLYTVSNESVAHPVSATHIIIGFILGYIDKRIARLVGCRPCVLQLFGKLLHVCLRADDVLLAVDVDLMLTSNRSLERENVFPSFDIRSVLCLPASLFQIPPQVRLTVARYAFADLERNLKRDKLESIRTLMTDWGYFTSVDILIC